MDNLFTHVFTQIISITFQICFWLMQTFIPWCFRHAFYFSTGLLFAALAPTVQTDMDTLLAFLIGVGIAATLDWFLSNFDVLYKQILFGITGFAAGWSLNMGIFPALALAGLSVWQSQHSSY